MKNAKNYEVGSEQELSGSGTGTVIKKRCYQCRKTSVVRGEKGKLGPFEGCLNGCGPEALAKMFRF